MRIWGSSLLPSRQACACSHTNPKISGEWHRSAARCDFPCQDQLFLAFRPLTMTPNYLTSLRCKCRLVSLNLINLEFIVQSCCMYDFLPSFSFSTAQHQWTLNCQDSRICFLFSAMHLSNEVARLKTRCFHFSVCFLQMLHRKDGFSFSA